MSHNDRTPLNEYGEFEVLIWSAPAEASGIAAVDSDPRDRKPIDSLEEFDVLICSYPSEPGAEVNSVEGDANDER